MGIREAKGLSLPANSVLYSIFLSPPRPTKSATDTELWRSPSTLTSIVKQVPAKKNRHLSPPKRISMPFNERMKSSWIRRNEPSMIC